ncbi:hypothetical protein AN958_11849 [Leucoagaricus sp. SymC.cos]|nr:hypothetical protein AN958_11849 [Leucoagaricus sp. SymC.cos]
MDPTHIIDDGALSAHEYTDDPVTEISEVSTPVTFSVDASPQLSEQPLPSDTATATQKKKKKKKSKKSSKAKETAGIGLSKTRSQGGEGESGGRPHVLCISRNKHWRYISSYHGPWLQLPIEILDSLNRLNTDPAIFEEQTPPESPRGVIASVAFSPTTGKPVPPPIDPGVMGCITQIRRLVDDATDLSVRASSGLSAVELGSVRNASSFNGSTWAAAQSLGFNPLGANAGGGRNTSMSANRVHRLRSLAVQKLAQAYRMDEIASSVMVMQGGSVFDDVAERVLKHDPHDPDAKYVHFFHEKISSSHRQLAASTPTTTLDELISAFPHQLEYYRTRGIVLSFREDFSLAIKDFTHALKEARTRRKNLKKEHHSDSRSTKSKKRRTTRSHGHTNGQAPPDGTAVPEGMVEGPDGDLVPLHPSIQPDAPAPIETQLLFLRGAAYLQQAVHLIEAAIIKLEGVRKPTGLDGADLRLCCLNSRYGGVEIGNPDGPLGSRSGAKAKAYREVLAAKPFRDQIHSLLKKSIRDHEKFLAYLDSGETASHAHIREGNIAYQVEFAFLLSEAIRPGNHNNPPPANMPDLVPALTTYHPLLIESHFSVLICYLMLGDFNALLSQFARTSMLVDGVEGYPVFLPPRSMGQAEFVEVLERLATGWKNGCQPHSLSDTHRGKARLVAAGSFDPPKLITPSISTSSITSTSSIHSTISTLSPVSSVPASSSAALLANAIAGIDLNSLPTSSSGSSTWAPGPTSTTTGADASHALDCARILLAPVIKRQRERTEQAVAEKAKGLKRKKSINIPLHGPRVEVILAWLGAVHFPELDNA